MIIEAHDLLKIFHVGSSPVHALRGASLEVEAGEFIAITGASGSGKSTLLYILGCLERPSGGRYRLDGKSVEALEDDELSGFRNRKIGFVFQTFNLIMQHNVLENVELPLVYSGVDKETRRERSLEILGRVGLKDKIYHRPGELSGGEAQRTAIARALAAGPSLLLADEPTGNLDSKTGMEIVGLFRDLNQQGATVVLVTHSGEIASSAGRIVEMRDGRIVRDSGRM
jgi:putative ABC transport system ATP-binding protein